MHRECAQTGAFLAATGAVCGDGVELVCVQLLAGEQNLYTGSYGFSLARTLRCRYLHFSMEQKLRIYLIGVCENPFRRFAPKTAPKRVWNGSALLCTHGTKPILSLGTQYHQTQQNNTITHKFWISHNPEVAGSSPVPATT